jgi:hypothetical protein
MGDFNYRIRGERAEVENCINCGHIEKLLKQDQLRWSQDRGLSFQALQEPPLRFKPTYKFDKGSDEYDSGPKQRIPAWTDRILYRPAMGLRCSRYDADFALRTSDHRPVFANFHVDVKLFGNLMTFDDDKEMFSAESQVCSIM